MQATTKLVGGCLCGRVRYEAEGAASGITHCHCRTCRRASGAPFVSWAGFEISKFRFTRGEPAMYRSSANVRRTFCAACGSALTYQLLELPDSIDITLGSMDDPEQLKPEDHTWTESRLSWILLCDQLPTYPRERPRE